MSSILKFARNVGSGNPVVGCIMMVSAKVVPRIITALSTKRKI